MKVFWILAAVAAVILLLVLLIAYLCYRMAFYAPRRKAVPGDAIVVPEGEVYKPFREPMEAFTDPKVRRIVMVAASQVGKSELELNIIGYIIDQDPGSILYVQPTLDDARKFSRLRIAPMITA